MMPLDHIKHSSWFSLVLWAVAGLPTAAVAFVSSLLIDIDHWLWSIWAFGHWSPFKAVRWHLSCLEDPSRKYHTCCVFHTVEFLSALGAVALFSPFARAVFVGCLFHIALDLYYHFSSEPDRRVDLRVKYLLTPFLSKLARREVYVRTGAAAARRR